MSQPNLKNATFIGEGRWIKNSAYQVYKLEEKYYAVVVVEQMNKELMEDTIIEIGKEDINKYII